MHLPVPSDFIELPIFADEWHFGAVTGIKSDILMPDRDWRSLGMSFEKQKKTVESSSCVTFSIHNGIEVLERLQSGRINDYSERYTSTLAGTTKKGNSPHKVLETIRSKGLIKEDLLPFTFDIQTWEQFYEPIPRTLTLKGKRWLKRNTLQHDWVIVPGSRRVEQAEKLMDALQFSPIPVSVDAWSERNGIYYRTAPFTDNHMCLLLYGDANYWYVLDTYAPFFKRLERSYTFGCAKRLSLTRRQSLFAGLW